MSAHSIHMQAKKRKYPLIIRISYLLYIVGTHLCFDMRRNAMARHRLALVISSAMMQISMIG